jgi:hypothetical protein
VETLMPRGPKGEKRPADVIGMSVNVEDLAALVIAGGAQGEATPALACGGRLMA